MLLLTLTLTDQVTAATHGKKELSTLRRNATAPATLGWDWTLPGHPRSKATASAATLPKHYSTATESQRLASHNMWQPRLAFSSTASAAEHQVRAGHYDVAGT